MTRDSEKTESFTFRLSKGVKDNLNVVSKKFGTSAGQLTALLVEKFIEEWQKNGKVAWPPEFKSDKAFVRIKVRVGYSIHVSFEDDDPYEESSPFVEWFLIDQLGTPADKISDTNYWVALYYQLNEQIEWLTENEFDERPLEVTLKVWNFRAWDQKKKRWIDLTNDAAIKSETALEDLAKSVDEGKPPSQPVRRYGNEQRGSRTNNRES
ncbi:hypothetical protein [Tichowtungia aerotolerans]|uniref:Uncharacterized protein n=1 Tax=Tichowtungia aerotolerans TaxID=2697043 RepID=A0A6P1M683_9BACT|nr:hypothetical protein [Tichowtungia aerotolerans]QHI69532.1 hypothetical protein GT409_08705 [Tichowtungia aerotolerans]